MESTDFLFDAGKLKRIQNEIYEQSTMLFDLLFHLQQELDEISIKWQGDAATAFMGEIHIWWSGCRKWESCFRRRKKGFGFVRNR